MRVCARARARACTCCVCEVRRAIKCVVCVCVRVRCVRARARARVSALCACVCACARAVCVWEVRRTAPGVFDYKGIGDCAAKLVRHEGSMALLDGAAARVLMITPRVTIAVSVKELLQPWFDAALGVP